LEYVGQALSFRTFFWRPLRARAGERNFSR
jgi:hypothetical protein